MDLKEETMPLETAVNTAVEECIEKGILQEFLCEQKAEVIAMSNSIQKIMESLDLKVDKACELLGISVEEYKRMTNPKNNSNQN